MLITTTSGPVRGRPTAHGTTFHGIPYAAPPTGAQRFAAPVPHPRWTDVRDATAPGSVAPQPARDIFGPLDLAPYFGSGRRSGGDYLTVDVWAPQTRGKPVPVLVFVHGGGFVAGSGSAPLYDGSAFARDGVMLVTVDYRLGIPGFLHLSDAPDNRGLLDVLAALRWIRDNAAAFGGDPGNVTLAGQSAGATIVGGILADPAATGLFHRAIMQSGNGNGAFTVEQAQIVTAAVGRELGLRPTARSLAGLDDQRLVDLIPALTGLDLRVPGHPDPLGGLTPFSLVLAAQPAAGIVAGPVDLLVGSNAEEGRLYLAPLGRLTTTTEADVLATAARFHDRPGEVVDAYRAARPEATAADLRTAILGDGLFGNGTRAMATAHAPAPGRTYSYEFTWRSGALDGQLGACHVMELPFVFDVLDLPSLRGEGALLGPAEPPAELARRMHAAWVSFAATGDPGWAPLEPGHHRVQQIGTTWKLIDDPRPPEIVDAGRRVPAGPAQSTDAQGAQR